MRYIIIDKKKSGDWYTEEFYNREDAEKRAEDLWYRLSLSKHDLKRCEAFYLLESENPDEDADNHWDGNPVRIWK